MKRIRPLLIVVSVVALILGAVYVSDRNNGGCAKITTTKDANVYTTVCKAEVNDECTIGTRLAVVPMGQQLPYGGTFFLQGLSGKQYRTTWLGQEVVIDSADARLC